VIELPSSWASIIFSEAVINISTTGKKIPQKDYLPDGLYPVIDQGQDYIGGFTLSKESVIECELPVIVFGDHTRIVKYIS
jgi:type I restriction enzyme, S subunit